MKLNSTVSTKAAVLGVLLSMACSTDKGAPGDGGAGSDGIDGAAAGSGGAGGHTTASGGKSGSGGNGGAGTSTGGGGAQPMDGSAGGDGGADGSAGPDGSPAADGSAGAGGTGTTAGGAIRITQVFAPDDYNVSAAFASSRGIVQRNSGETCTTTTSGACIASLCTSSSADAGPDAPIPDNGLNAGVIDVTGAGTAKAELTYALVPMTMISTYKSVSAAARFFTGGETLTVTGAGGPDLPAFAKQTMTAPSKLVLTAPVCGATGCSDVDRTKDMAVTWTGVSEGKFTVTLETIGTDAVSIATCSFDAKSGKGTVPKAVLALLGTAGDGTTTGIETFIASNSTEFMVGKLPTTFTASIAVEQTSLTVSK
jgi:hypothetical protein